MGRRYVLEEPKPRKGPPPAKKGAKLGKGWIYRVGWQRRDRNTGEKLRPKYKHFFTWESARRFYRMFGPEPWRFFRNRMAAGDPWPCRECHGDGVIVRDSYRISPSGYGARVRNTYGCAKCFGGCTVSQYIHFRRLELPEILWVRLERRPVGAWEDTEETWEDGMDGETTDRLGSLAAREDQVKAMFTEETLSLTIPRQLTSRRHEWAVEWEVQADGQPKPEEPTGPF